MTPSSSPSPFIIDSSSEVIDRGAFEFVAFFLWYLFLVLCCIVPTCFAYRRRRILEARLGGQNNHHEYWEHHTAASLEQLQQLQRAHELHHNGGVYLLPSWQQRQEIFRNTQDLMESDTAKMERTRRMENSLEATSMIVQARDLKENNSFVSEGQEGGKSEITGDSDDANKTPKSIVTDEEMAISTHMQEIEDAVLADLDITSVLQLPSTSGDDDTKHPRRAVPAVCAICLCGYEVGDCVSWSQNKQCPHAFHHDCIVPWLAKKNEAEPQCPCCRQAYCEVEPVTLMDLVNARPTDSTTETVGGTTVTRTSATTTLTPLEFIMALRTGGNSLFVLQDVPGRSLWNNENTITAVADETHMTLPAQHDLGSSSSAHSDLVHASAVLPMNSRNSSTAATTNVGDIETGGNDQFGDTTDAATAPTNEQDEEHTATQHRTDDNDIHSNIDR